MSIFTNAQWFVIRQLKACICALQGGESSPANPTASIGLTPVDGVAATFMRSDAAPAIDQAIIPVWTGIHTFAANPILKSTVPSLEYQLSDNTQLGFINMGDGAANVPAFINPLVSDQLRIVVGTAPNATFTFANAGQFGIGNPVNFGTLGQVITSGGPTGVISWSTPVIPNLADVVAVGSNLPINSNIFFKDLDGTTNIGILRTVGTNSFQLFGDTGKTIAIMPTNGLLRLLDSTGSGGTSTLSIELKLGILPAGSNTPIDADMTWNQAIANLQAQIDALTP